MTKTTKPDPTGVDDPTDPAHLPADRPGLKPHPDHELPESEKPGRPGRPGQPDQGLPGEGTPGDGDAKPGDGKPDEGKKEEGKKEEAKTQTGASGPRSVPAVIFADGPHQGAESLPAGAVEGPGNELHVPHDTGLVVYMRADPSVTEGHPEYKDVPAYRLFRTEPQYRKATAPPVLDPPAGEVLSPARGVPAGATPHRDELMGGSVWDGTDAVRPERDTKADTERDERDRYVKAVSGQNEKADRAAKDKADPDATDDAKDAKDKAERNPKSRDVKA